MCVCVCVSDYRMRLGVVTTALLATPLHVTQAAYGDIITSYVGHTSNIYAMDVNSEYVIANGYDGTTRQWHRGNGSPLFTLFTPGSIFALAMGTSTFASTVSGYRIAEYWLRNGSLSRVYAPAFLGQVRRVAFIEPDRLMGCAMNGTLQIWSRSNGSLLRQFNNLPGHVTDCFRYDHESGGVRLTVALVEPTRQGIYEMMKWTRVGSYLLMCHFILWIVILIGQEFMMGYCGRRVADRIFTPSI